MVERSRRAREEEAILAALVRDVDPAFLNVDVWCAVLAHSAELDDVAIGRVLQAGPDRVERSFEVVAQRAPGRIEPHHRVGCRRLFRVVYRHIRPDVGEQLEHHAAVGAVADYGPDFPPGHLAKDSRPVGQVGAMDQRFRASLQGHLAPKVIVDCPNLVSLCSKPHCCRPAKIAVTAKHDNTHALLPQSKKLFLRRNSRSSSRVIDIALVEL